MITYKGRVVYERIKHKMTEKDAARIMAAVTADLGPAALAKKLWGIDMKIVELGVLSDDDILVFVKTILKLLINWVGPGLDWLWDFLRGFVGVGSPAQPGKHPEENDG